MQEDVRNETTAAALRKSLRLENNSSDRGNVFYTEASNYIRHQGQESYVELDKYEKCTTLKEQAFLNVIFFLLDPLSH